MIKCILFLFLCIRVFGFGPETCRVQGHEDWFCEYMEKHNRTYSYGNVLRRKKKLLKKHVSQNGVIFGLTSRSDRFRNEKIQNLHLKHSHHLKVARAPTNNHVHLAAPKHMAPIDWRNVNGKSYVSSVKDQGDCGGCFAFASATILEFWSREEGDPKSLSPQSLMDCTSFRGKPDDGCEGGLMEYVFEYAKKHPVPLEVDQPYLERDATCSQMPLWSHVQVGAYKVLMHDTNRRAERAIETLLHAYGPISVGIDSTSDAMENYKGGIFKASMCGKDIDHAVTIVGYTKNAWIIKNSWGPKWGVDGYLYLERGKNACGVAEYIVYVTNAKPILREENTKWVYKEWNGWGFS